MKKMTNTAFIAILSICLTIILTSLIFSNYKLNKIKLENKIKLNVSAIKAGMIQVPVDIHSESHQELMWVNPKKQGTDGTMYLMEEG